MARNGYLLTSCKKVEFAEGDENEKSMQLHNSQGFVWTEMINGTLYSFKAAAVWNMENIISSASMWLKFAEERAKASGNLYSWQIAAKEAKAKAAKKAKKAKKTPSAIEKAIKQLNAAFAKGEINSIELAAKLAEFAA